MATEAVTVSRWQAALTFMREAFHEVRHKTTWPEFAQVRQASIAIVIFVLLIGLLITLLDLALRGVLVQLVPSLFR
jgi:preprotein translocase SecE subunit